MEQCVTNQDFAKAAELKQQITDLEEQKEILDSQENSFSQTIREEKVILIWRYLDRCTYIV